MARERRIQTVKPRENGRQTFLKRLDSIYHQARMSNGVLVFLKLGLAKEQLVRIPICLMVSRKLERLTPIDALFPK